MNLIFFDYTHCSASFYRFYQPFTFLIDGRFVYFYLILLHF
jgi:hypothetical protein